MTDPRQQAAEAREDDWQLIRAAIVQFGTHDGSGQLASDAWHAERRLREKWDALCARLEQAEAALREIADSALNRYVDWMHFHEVAMDDPFRAESQARAYAKSVRAAALSVEEKP